MKRRTELFLKLLAGLGVVLLHAYSASASAEGIPPENHLRPEYHLLKAAADKRIIPGHQTLLTHAKAMESAAETFCKEPRDSTFVDLKAAWTVVMHSWSTLAPINFGPIDSTNATWKFQFWPDRMNLVHRKFASRISGKNPEIGAEELARASVAIQGLSALEYLVFDEALATVENYRSQPHLCRILRGTMQNLVWNADQLNQAWQQEYGKRFYDSQLEKTHPGTFKLHVEKLFSGVVMALGAIKDQKLGKPLTMSKTESATPEALSENGKNTSRALNPWLLESWRSQTSLQQISAILHSILALYEMDKGLGWFVMWKSPQFEPLDQEIRHGLQDAIKQIDSIHTSAFQLLQNNEPDSLIRLHQRISRLYRLLKLDYAKAADIEFRFNAHDGD